MTRYDAHRNLIVEETNDIGTAYRRLDLLPTNSQPGMRQLFREYATSRLHLYDTVAPEISAESLRLQDVIWQQAVQDCSAPGANPDATKLLLPALNSMFDITPPGRMLLICTRPPSSIYCCLFSASGAHLWLAAACREQNGTGCTSWALRSDVYDLCDSGDRVSSTRPDSPHSHRSKPGASARFDELVSM